MGHPAVACMESLLGECQSVLMTLICFTYVILVVFFIPPYFSWNTIPNVAIYAFVPWGAWLFIAHTSEGSNLTPAHHYPDFRFKTYAPLAFRYFRDLFGIKPDDYLVRLKPGRDLAGRYLFHLHMF